MRAALGAIVAVFVATTAAAQGGRQVEPAPPRGSQGDGPFQRLILRGAVVIDGTGAPPAGPKDIVIENNRIVEIKSVGSPGVAIDESRRPNGATKELDVDGMYVMPGFVDLHTHTGGVPKAPEAEYVYKLWMAHGVTTTRDAGAGARDLVLSEKRRSAANEIVAPRIFAYARPGTGEGWDGGPITHRRDGARVGALGRGERHRRAQARLATTRTSWKRSSTRRRRTTSGRWRTSVRTASRG